MTLKTYWGLVEKLKTLGYEEERWWCEELSPCPDKGEFVSQTIWVILNSGMKEQIARKIYDKVLAALRKSQNISEVFGHKGKVAAIKHVVANSGNLFKEYLDADDKIEYLVTIPFIGNITKYHLAKNLGHDCCKPDRHLVRIADQYNTTPDALCRDLAKVSGDRLATVDVVIWRACNLELI